MILTHRPGCCHVAADHSPSGHAAIRRRLLSDKFILGADCTDATRKLIDWLARNAFEIDLLGDPRAGHGLNEFSGSEVVSGQARRGVDRLRSGMNRFPMES